MSNAQLGQAPRFNLMIAFGQSQSFAVLQLRQKIACAVINSSGAQGGIGAYFIEQGLGTLLRIKRVGDQVRF